MEKLNMFDVELSRVLKVRRKQLEITQKDLAEKFHLNSPVFISLLESGKQRLPRTWIRPMARYLKLPTHKITHWMIKSATYEIRKYE